MNKDTDKRFNVYTGEKEGLPVSIMADPNYQTSLAKDNCPWYLWVRIEIKDADSQGQPTKEEDNVLNGFEDSIDEELSKSTSIHFVGRVTWNKDRQLFYYVADAELANTILQKLIENPTRPLEYKIEKDPEWNKVKDILVLD